MIRGARFGVRARITAVSALVGAIVLCGLGIVVALQADAASSAAAQRLALDDLTAFRVDLRAQPREDPDLPAAGLLVLVQDPRGRVLRDSMPAPLAAAAREVTGTAEVHVEDDRFTVVAVRVTNRFGVWRLWAARDRSASDRLVAGVLTAVRVGVPVGVALIALSAWLVASAALRPVERLRAAAERLRGRAEQGTLPSDGGPELGRLAATLNALIVDLRGAAALERRVTADAAHELRTPLAVLGAQVQLAERDAPGPQAAAVRASVERLTRLVDDLLALSRADAAADGPLPSSTVGDLVTEAMAAVDRGRLLAPRDVLVDLELGGDLDEGAEVPIDVIGFARVLTNLVANAVAAAPATAVIVRVDRDGDTLLVVVRDDGRGVPADFLPVAFDRFSRPVASRGADGSGLGLALVRRLAEAAGGSAVLENATPRGAVATVRLPIVRGRPRS